MQVFWNAISRSEWERRIDQAPDGVAPLQQDWAYGEAMRQLGGETARVSVEIDGRPAALAQFSLRRLGFGGFTAATWALCSRGPLWLNDPSEAEKAAIYREIRRSAPFGKRRALFFSPDEEAPSAGLAAAGLRRVMTGYSTATLDLTQDLSEIEAGMRGKWRNRLRAAEREGLLGGCGGLDLRSSRPPPEAYAWLIAEETAQQKRNGYRGLPSGFTAAYQAAQESRQPKKKRDQAPRVGAARGVRLLRLDQDGAPIAAMLFLIHGAGATYHIGWSSEEGKRRGAHNALLWRAIQELKAIGLRQLDLGGVDTERGAGIARFKLGVGARPVTLCGTYL